MADFLKMDLQDDFAAGLDRLADVVKEKVVRAGGNSIAYTFQEEAKALAPTYTVQFGRKKPKKVKPGQLRDSIYRVFAQSESHDGLTVYEVTWNHTKAPHGHWMEFGNSRHGAHPYLRPAYEAAKARALQAGIDRMAVKFAQSLLEPA